VPACFIGCNRLVPTAHRSPALHALGFVVPHGVHGEYTCRRAFAAARDDKLGEGLVAWRHSKQAIWMADHRAAGTSRGMCQPTPWSQLGNVLTYPLWPLPLRERGMTLSGNARDTAGECERACARGCRADSSSVEAGIMGTKDSDAADRSGDPAAS